MYLIRTLFNVTKLNRVCYSRLFTRQQQLYSCYVNKYHLTLLILTNSSRCLSDTPLKCWNCDFLYKSDLFCSKCKVLQEPPENLTYFDIIGISKSYNVEVTEIQRRYKDLQKMLHPDKFSNKSEKEKQISENVSALLNKAYSTLTNPLKRGLYILKLNNIIISEETNNANAEFLMEIMEKNEEIEEAGNDVEKIKKLFQENESMLDNLTRDVADAFNKEDLKKAETLLIQMKYYDSINTRLKKLKHDLGIVE